MNLKPISFAAIAVLVLGVFAAKGGHIQNLFYTAITESTSAQVMSASEAYEQLQARTIFLIDIRRPDEWGTTGSGEGALRLDMRRDNFIIKLRELTSEHPNRPVALICARGVRSARLSNQLINAGFDAIIDIPEGMLGSAAGPGWIKRGLPLVY